ncbi:hypothetical protein [Streptomyces sp. NPDC001927]
MDQPADGFVELPGWTKGMVWLNGCALGPVLGAGSAEDPVRAAAPVAGGSQHPHRPRTPHPWQHHRDRRHPGPRHTRRSPQPRLVGSRRRASPSTTRLPSPLACAMRTTGAAHHTPGPTATQNPTRARRRPRQQACPEMGLLATLGPETSRTQARSRGLDRPETQRAGRGSRTEPEPEPDRGDTDGAVAAPCSTWRTAHVPGREQVRDARRADGDDARGMPWPEKPPALRRESRPPPPRWMCARRGEGGHARVNRKDGIRRPGPWYSGRLRRQ